MASLLSAHGYDTEEYPSAEEFLLAATASKATCLVVDIQLGDISGVELMRQLYATGFRRPVIFMTGSRDEVIREQAMDLGCVSYLRKPFPASQLLKDIPQRHVERDVRNSQAGSAANSAARREIEHHRHLIPGKGHYERA